MRSIAKDITKAKRGRYVYVDSSICWAFKLLLPSSMHNNNSTNWDVPTVLHRKVIRTVPGKHRKRRGPLWKQSPNCCNSLGTDFEGYKMTLRPSSIEWEGKKNVTNSKPGVLVQKILGIKCPYLSYKTKCHKTFSSSTFKSPKAHNMISSTKWRLLRSDKHLQVLEEIQLPRCAAFEGSWIGIFPSGARSESLSRNHQGMKGNPNHQLTTKPDFW